MNRQQCFKILNIYKTFKETKKIRNAYVSSLIMMPVVDMPLDKEYMQKFANVILPGIQEMAVKEKEIINRINQIPAKNTIIELEGASVVAEAIKYLAEQIIIDLQLFEEKIKNSNKYNKDFLNNLRFCTMREYSIFFEIYISILEINILNDILNDDYLYKILEKYENENIKEEINKIVSYIKTLFSTEEDYKIIHLFLKNYLSEDKNAHKLLKEELKRYQKY